MIIPLYDDNPTRRWPIVTLLIILANVGIHFVMESYDEAERNSIVANRGFVPQRIGQLSDPQLEVEVNVTLEEDWIAAEEGKKEKRLEKLPADPSSIFSSVFSSMFLHANWLHLIGNMWLLWIFGNNIEDRLGHTVFTIFYLLCGVFAVGCHWAIHPSSNLPMIGASGAIAGVQGAYAITFPRAKIRTLVFVFLVNVPAMVWLGLWFVVQILDGLDAIKLGVNGGIAFGAHVGGFVTGLIVMPLLSLGAPDPGTHWEDELEEQFDFDRYGRGDT